MSKYSLIVAALVVGLAVVAQPRIVRAGDDCSYNDARFSDGALSCQDGKRYKCEDGEWKSKDERCTTAKSETSRTHERVIEKKETDTEESD